tara:strand:- start:111 stop:677 length:567 start_codon:yes stop_codon:yes gene_type:complete
MRVIGGKLRGNLIHNPTDKSTRPLKDVVRESIFNILKHSNNEKIELLNSNVLDLFSGTGSFGLECLSRGAKRVYFFENYENSIKILKKNIIKLKQLDNCRIIEKDAYDLSSKDLDNKVMDLIFIDPPFKDIKINILLDNIKNLNITKKNTLIILHRSKRIKEEFIDSFKILREQTYGVSKILFGEIST